MTTTAVSVPSLRVGLCALALAVLAGCASSPAPRKAPVTDRLPGATTPAAAAVTLPGAENAGKPGYYTVRQGDTLIRIGLDSGQNWRDIQAWNSLTDPNRIEIGQVLRVAPPVAAAPAPVAGAAAPAATPGAPVVGAVPSGSATARPLGSTGPAPVATATPAPASAPVPAASGADELAFIWPTKGTVIENFDEARNKGIGIAGRSGEPVLAAADGQVVYAGAGLRGYGNLIILKHNNTYLTTYAHNQSLLVREDQAVKQGQKIAEMGSSDADRVKLHFEVRRQGKPVDPLTFLPKR